MKIYVNKDGKLVKAIQYNTEDDKKAILEEFTYHDTVYPGNYYSRKESGDMGSYAPDYFEKHYKEISEARRDAVERLYRKMLIEMSEKQALGKKDNWREKEWMKLQDWITEEIQELFKELWELEGNTKKADLEKLMTEAAHVGLCLAFLVDKAIGLQELDGMWREQDGD